MILTTFLQASDPLDWSRGIRFNLSHVGLIYFDSPFRISIILKIKITCHLTIKNENRPNPRTATPEKKGPTAFE